MSVDQDNVIEQIKSERKFLHDISSPLMIATGMVSTAKAKTDEPEVLLQKLDKAYDALIQITDKLKSRRSDLINQMEALDGEK